MIARDEATSWATAVPLVKKESRLVADAFDKSFGFNSVKLIRCDPGREFEGQFLRRATEAGAVVQTGIPHRPQTHSRAERLHKEVEGAWPIAKSKLLRISRELIELRS